MMSSENVENLAPSTIKSVAREMAELLTSPPEGIKVLQNDDDLTDIQAIIEGPVGTPYAGGAFHMKLILGKQYPEQPPKGYFITKIFHPNVASNGEICVNTLKKDWSADLGLKHILLVVKCLLINPNPESALNEEAGKLLLEQYEDFASKAKLYTEIHARSHTKHKSECSAMSESCGSKKASLDSKKIAAKKKTDKKKILKRL